MEGNRPKRRKDKYNPYTICEKDGQYYVSLLFFRLKEHSIFRLY